MRATLAIDLNTKVLDRQGGDHDAIDRDQELIDRFRGGEARAFDELVRRYQQPVFYLCLRYLKNDADSKDVSQRAFVRAFQKLETFRGESTFRTWLYRIAINLSLNYLRDHRREQPTEISDAALTRGPTGPMRIIGDEQSIRLRAAIEALPPKQRQVLELRIFDELPFREVAALADCTENAAKVNFHHAVKKLRALLAAQAEES
ncbi:MAG TPA: sigma-70 family RNA polymerase sigma factor [Kofleriaceae bacterium]|nr:sigma-70 family RNA polymerase sigma factor [Kofleriaceae bacterium]